MKKFISVFISVLFLLCFSNSISAQVSGYFEGPLGTVPIYSGGSSNNGDLIELESSILKKKNETYSISFSEYNKWFFVKFNKIGFSNQRNVIVVEILGNCSKSSTVSCPESNSSVGDYILVDGVEKKILSMAIYDVYSKK